MREPEPELEKRERRKRGKPRVGYKRSRFSNSPSADVLSLSHSLSFSLCSLLRAPRSRSLASATCMSLPYPWILTRECLYRGTEERERERERERAGDIAAYYSSMEPGTWHAPVIRSNGKVDRNKTRGESTGESKK